MKKLIVGNWKLYVRTLVEGRKLLRDIDTAFPRGTSSSVVVCPPNALSVALRDGYKGKRIAFGGQDIADVGEGAQTGEISAANFVGSGVTYTIIGHAERREKGDSDEVVARKVATALAARLHPIVCVGEPERDKEGGHFSYLKKNVTESLARVESSDAKRLTIAYDPRWAIGNADAPAPRIVREAVIYIRKTLADMWGREQALKTRIIYGGSVDAESALQFANEKIADGLLVGRASVDAKEFSAIVKAFK